MRRRLMTELPSREINHWQVQGGDICIQPVGSSEVLGPYLPLGGRSFVAEAFSRLLAENVDGIYLPVLPLTPVFGTQTRCGSIDVSETEVNHILRALLDDMLETGFRRILLVTYLDYACRYLPVEFYEDHQVAAVGVHLYGALNDRAVEKGIEEDSLVLGALRVLGREQVLAKCLAAAEHWKADGKRPAPLPETYVRLSEVGRTGVNFPKDYYPMPPSENLDPDAGAEVLRASAADKAPALESLRAYNEYLARRDSRGFLRGGWFSDEEGGAR